MSVVLQRNIVQIIGRGDQPIFFAHGYGCDQNMWRFITPAFEDRYRIVLFDHVGHGQSDPTALNPIQYGSLQGYADDVLAICRDMDLKDVIFVGHSVSAMVGILAANREPERFDRLGRHVHQNLPGSAFVLMKATGHCSNLGAPEEMIAAIEAFLRGSAPNRMAAE